MKLQIQGDVALKEVTIDGNFNFSKKVEKKVLAWGEISGHAHVVTGDAEVFEIEGKMYVVVGNDGAKLEHQIFKQKTQADHNPIELKPKTTYEVILQNEFNPYADAWERVID